MKLTCPMCGRRVRVVDTATALPRLVTHSVRVSTSRQYGIPSKTACHGSRLPAFDVDRLSARSPEFFIGTR